MILSECDEAIAESAPLEGALAHVGSVWGGLDLSAVVAAFRGAQGLGGGPYWARCVATAWLNFRYHRG